MTTNSHTSSNLSKNKGSDSAIVFLIMVPGPGTQDYSLEALKRTISLNPGIIFRIVLGYFPEHQIDKAKFTSTFKNILFVEGNESDLPQSIQNNGSVQHGFLLNLILKSIKAKALDYILVLDPDFFIIKRDLVQEVINEMDDKALSFYGSPYLPRKVADFWDFPTVFFFLIKVNEQLQIAEIDFLPEITRHVEYQKKFSSRVGVKFILSLQSRVSLSRLSSNHARIVNAVLNYARLVFVGPSKAPGDTGFRLREQYRKRSKFGMFQVISREQFTTFRLPKFNIRSYIAANVDLPNDEEFAWWHLRYLGLREGNHLGIQPVIYLPLVSLQFLLSLRGAKQSHSCSHILTLNDLPSPFHSVLSQFSPYADFYALKGELCAIHWGTAGRSTFACDSEKLEDLESLMESDL